MTNRNHRRMIRDMKRADSDTMRRLRVRAARAIESFDVIGQYNDAAMDRLIDDIRGNA